MAAPYELRDATLRRLRQTRAAMMGLAYLLEFETLPPERQKQAALELARTQTAYLKLRAARLADIRDALAQNEPALRKGLDRVERALRLPQRVEAILQAISSLLSVVGRIVA